MGGRITQALAEQTEFELHLGVLEGEDVSPACRNRGHLVPMDVASEKSVANACRGMDSIVHLAAVNEIVSAADPEAALLINGLGTLHLLRAAEREGVKRFIYFSTAHVYGSPLVGRIAEDSLARPVHPYAITHRVAEDFVFAAHDREVLTGIVLRLSNGTGAPADPQVDRWTLVGNDLCRQAVTTGKLVLRSSGLQQRDFVALADVSRAVLHMLRLPPEQCGNGLFNVGGENSISIIDLARLVAETCQTTLGFLPPIIAPEPKSDEKSEPLQYCIDKLKATGFRREGSLTEEIRLTLNLCQKAFEAQPR